MTEPVINPGHNLDAALKALRVHLLEKGNRFERGPAYSGNGRVLASIQAAVKLYEGLGYAKLLEIGDPPFYAFMQRGHREAHLLQPQNPELRRWLEDGRADLNDARIREHQLRQSGLSEAEIPVARKPHHFHVNEVDGVFIATADDHD
jgi:hypothetical protein